MGKARTGALADWIKSRRTEKGWSQTRLQMRMRTHPHVTLISRWEGGRHEPDARHLAELARVFQERPPSDDEEDEGDPVAAAMQAIDTLLLERARAAFRLAREEARTTPSVSSPPPVSPVNTGRSVA